MTISKSLLFEREYVINDNIKIVIPTVGEILSFGESTYYGLVSNLTSMPIDMLVELDDLGIDFTEINEYELFCLLFPILKSQDTHLIFGNLDISKFELAINEQNGELVLIDKENDIMIDRSIQLQISSVLRKIHHLEKNNRKPGNDEAKRYLLERARRKRKRKSKDGDASQMESLIVAMVNTEEFKYTFETVKDLTIYQFNESVRQIIKKVEFNNRMIGVYAGTVNAKELSQDDVNWLIHK
jgi:hypothetical protein